MPLKPIAFAAIAFYSPTVSSLSVLLKLKLHPLFAPTKFKFIIDRGVVNATAFDELVKPRFAKKLRYQHSSSLKHQLDQVALTVGAKLKTIQ